MYILEPVYHETVWGGDRLKRFTGENNHFKAKIGHLYLIDGHEQMANKILNGDDKGQTLREVFEREKGNWGLSQYAEFPLTIALVDALDNLSIQVHPDDIAAAEIEGKKIGKTESWLFLEAPESGWIYTGCRCDSLEDVRNAVGMGRMEEITDRVPIQKNDYICIQAGTLHAMTRGSLVYEIEYGSDFTYRFYDYDRVDAEGNGRELHVEKAIQSIKTSNCAEPVASKEDGWIREEAYEICLKKNVVSYENSSSRLECLAILNGDGYADGQKLSGGMGIILLPGERIEGNLECFVAARLMG